MLTDTDLCNYFSHWKFWQSQHLQRVSFVA